MTIKNLKLKLLIVKTVFPFLSWINSLLKHRDNRVLIYCNLSFRDNNKAIYDYMIEKGFNQRYKIIVSSSDYKDYLRDTPANVNFVGPFHAIIAYFRCRWIFYCIGKIPIALAKDQVSIHMNHGMPIKEYSEGQYMQADTACDFFTYVLSTGKVFVPSLKRIYNIPDKNFLISGNPKCDNLFKERANYDFGHYKKLILWVPTFRKSVSLNMDDTGCNSKIVPVLNDENFGSLDEYLGKLGVKIVVKLHTEQDLSKYSMQNFNNFILLSHQEFVGRGMDINHFMTQADAMITDYSSIYYDFMLLNKPIAFTNDDIKEYSQKRGLAMDPEEFRPGEKLNNFDDICLFVKHVANEIDEYKEKREYVNHLVNEYQNGNYSKRVLDVMGIV